MTWAGGSPPFSTPFFPSWVLAAFATEPRLTGTQDLLEQGTLLAQQLGLIEVADDLPAPAARGEERLALEHPQMPRNERGAGSEHLSKLGGRLFAPRQGREDDEPGGRGQGAREGPVPHHAAPGKRGLVRQRFLGHD